MLYPENISLKFNLFLTINLIIVTTVNTISICSNITKNFNRLDFNTSAEVTLRNFVHIKKEISSDVIKSMYVDKIKIIVFNIGIFKINLKSINNIIHVSIVFRNGNTSFVNTPNYYS